MNHHPVKAFPLSQNGINNLNKRVPSPAGANQQVKNRYSESTKKTPNHLFIDNFALNDDSNSQMRRSKSSGILRKSDQNGNQLAQNSAAKNNKIGEIRGSSTSTAKNAQDSIISSLQSILNSQTQQQNSTNAASSNHKRTQSTNLTGSGLIIKSAKNNQIGNYNQFSQDQQLTKSQLVLNEPSSVLNKSINKLQQNQQQQQQQDYAMDYNNLKSLSSKNIYKPSTINQNRYTPSSTQNKNGVKGYATIQSRIETNDRLPKLESLIQQQQQQQMQPMVLGQNNSNVNPNHSINKGQSKETLKSKLQNDLFKDNEGNHMLNSLISSKNAKQQNGQTLSNSGLFSQGPKININLQIKNLNIISPNGLRSSNQAQTNDNTPNNYHQEENNMYEDNQDSTKPQSLNRNQHSRNPTQVINLQQNQNRMLGVNPKQNQSAPNIFTNNQQQMTQNKLINGNSSNALVNGYNGYQQTTQKNQQQNQSESRQSSRRARSNSKEKNESFSQQPKSGKTSSNPLDFMGKYANPFGKSTSNLNSQTKPQSQSIDAQRRNSKKQSANTTANDIKPAAQQIIRKNSSHLQVSNTQNTNQLVVANSIKQNIVTPAPKSIISSYAVRSKPGALPGKPVKTNQDSYIITTNFCKQKQKYLFSVCDGHGINGHHASQYVKKVLGLNIEFFLRQFCKEEFSSIEQNQTPTENFSAITQSLTSGFLKTAAGLLDSGIDITFSGSTCVSVYITQERYWCANIGDSRAIVGRQDPTTNQWSNQPLSIDHKPDLQAEYDRIMASGGRVEPFKDMEGNPVGPARVWMRHENIPGLAMARSFGDYVASQVGVIPEPEILHFDINPNDRFLVVASDGIWEFLSNEDVVSMIVPFYYKNDPEGACEKLVKEATAAWKREDEVIDDITCVIAFLNK